MLLEAFVALFGFATAEGSMAPLRQFMANGSAGVVTAIAMHLGSRSSACKSISNLLKLTLNIIIITSDLKHTLSGILSRVKLRPNPTQPLELKAAVCSAGSLGAPQSPYSRGGGVSPGSPPKAQQSWVSREKLGLPEAWRVDWDVFRFSRRLVLASQAFQVGLKAQPCIVFWHAAT